MNYKHGLSGHSIRELWGRIKQKCYGEINSNYEIYGGRGIKMYPSWRVDFILFYDYVTALPNYDEKKLGRKGGLTLDRINNNGNYEPGNLRWATYHIQAINQRIKKNNKTGYIGVSFEKSTNRYKVRIGINGIRVHLGRYNILEEAVKVRDQYIIDHDLIEYPLQIL